jgi:hypothetical protein
MEFDPFGLSVKDLTTKNVIVRLNSTGPLYTMRLPGFLTPSSSAVPPLLLFPTPLLLLLRPHGAIVLVILTLTPYLIYSGHLLFSVSVRNIIFVVHVS